MADVKISALNSATLPLEGTELIPIVQSGETKNVAINNINTLKGFHSPFPLASGQKTSPLLYGSTTNLASTAERAIAIPYMPSQNITTSDLYVSVSTLGLGATFRVYIYSDLNLYPDQLLFQSTDISAATTGTKTISTTFNFVAGQVYWLVFHSSTGIQASYTTYQSTPPSLPSVRLSGAAGFGTSLSAYTTITYSGAVPTTFPAGATLSSLHPPIIGITKA